MAFWLFTVCYLVLIFFHDLDFMLIPDAAVYPGDHCHAFLSILEISRRAARNRELKAPITVSALLAAFAAACFFFLLDLGIERKMDRRRGREAGVSGRRYRRMAENSVRSLFRLYDRRDREPRAHRGQEKNLEKPDSFRSFHRGGNFDCHVFFGTDPVLGEPVFDIGY